MILFHFSVQTIYLGCWTDTNSFSVLDEDSYMNIGKCKTIARDNGKSICGLKVILNIIIYQSKNLINRIDQAKGFAIFSHSKPNTFSLQNKKLTLFVRNLYRICKKHFLIISGII